MYHDDFADEGFVVVSGFIREQESLSTFHDYVLIKQLEEGYFRREKSDALSLGRYADSLCEAYLISQKGKMEKVTGLRLLPGYSYLRVYHAGSSLPRHIDRPTCEITATIVIGYEADRLWPLSLAGKDGARRDVLLDRGDMIVFRGSELQHWRDPFAGKYWMQMLLHYVDADGAQTRYAYDGRPRIGAPRSTSSLV